MRFARRWRAIANEHLSRIGQTQARWEALYWIAVSQGGATQRELAECVGIEEPTLVRMLHRLEQEGLVERRASQADRRTKTIVLTKAAEPHMKAMSGVIDKLRVDVLRNINDEEIKQAVESARPDARAAGSRKPRCRERTFTRFSVRVYPLVLSLALPCKVRTIACP